MRRLKFLLLAFFAVSLSCPLEAKTTTRNVFYFLGEIQRGESAVAIKMIKGKIKTAQKWQYPPYTSPSQFISRAMKCDIMQVEKQPEEDHDGYLFSWFCGIVKLPNGDTTRHDMWAYIKDNGRGVVIDGFKDRIEPIVVVPRPNPVFNRASPKVQ